jgi:hypothetical protein
MSKNKLLDKVLEERAQQPPKERNKWNEEILIELYEWAKEGMHAKAIAEKMGLNFKLFRMWMRKHPSMAVALQRGYDARKASGANYEEFVHGRLSPRAKVVWDKLQEVSKASSRFRKPKEFFRIAREAPTRIRQELFVYAMIHNNFSASRACERVGVGGATFSNWQKDPGFVEMLQAIQEAKKDFFESHLIKLVRQGDTAATIFANRTLNRDRGYNDKVQIDVSGTIQHTHSLEEQDLPLEVRRALLQAMRDKAQKALPKPADVQDAEFEEIKENNHESA